MLQWSELKSRLVKLSQSELIGILKDLHSLSSENKTFLQANAGGMAQESLEVYKAIIREAVDPDIHSSIDLRRGKKAISDYAKAAPKDLNGKIELMLCYVEAGTAQTLAFGDINEAFYNSLCSMVDRILETGPKLENSAWEALGPRLAALSDSVSGKIGWGFSDHLEDAALAWAELQKKRP